MSTRVTDLKPLHYLFLLNQQLYLAETIFYLVNWHLLLSEASLAHFENMKWPY